MVIKFNQDRSAMSERRLVTLDDRYPDKSRMTRWRIEHEPHFPSPMIIRGRKYYDADELTAWEESRRRRRQQESSPSTRERRPTA
jgi:hypothetical protein